MKRYSCIVIAFDHCNNTPLMQVANDREDITMLEGITVVPSAKTVNLTMYRKALRNLAEKEFAHRIKIN